MGKGATGLSSSRSECIPEEKCDSELEYRYIDGCFVSTKKAIGFAIFAVLTLIIAILLMYFYGPDTKKIVVEEVKQDIEELLNNTINSAPKEINIKLPTNLHPIYYKLKIHPVLDEYGPDNFTFTGQVEIIINCKNKTNEIILHYEDINVPEANITVGELLELKITEKNVNSEENKMNDNANSTEQDFKEHADSEALITSQEIDDFPLERYKYKDSQHLEALEDNNSASSLSTENKDTYKDTTEDKITEINYLQIGEVVKDSDNQKLKIVLKNSLEIGNNYSVYLQFSGNITDNLIGLYKTSYRDGLGQKRWIATTRFQPIFARRVFPCFDEPYIKTRFEIILARRTNMTALSNMPLKITKLMEDNPGWVWDHFQQSFPMSTHLVGFTICDFENITSDVTTSGPTLNVWAPKEDLPQTTYALQVARIMLQYLENYFGVVHPVPKIDLIVIPNFGQIALENLGLISFRKTSIILDPKSDSMASKINVFTIVAHQIAQQWLRNLVTIEWWDTFLLMEGLGEFVAEMLEQNLRPKWHRYENFPVRITHQVLSYDSLRSARSVETSITNTAQIEQISDSITTDKATCLFRMLNYTLTEPLLKKGLRNYLQISQHSQHHKESLWNSLNKAILQEELIPSGLSLETFMSSWTKHKGYPYVTINRDYQTNKAVISQKRFVENNFTGENTWYIPLTYIDSSDYSHSKVWLVNESTTLSLKADNESWILFNIDQTGFYRVNYDDRNWHLLKTQLFMRPEIIPVPNRAQLLNDAFELARMGIIEYKIPLELTKYLIDMERNYIPWMSALHVLTRLRSIINNYEYTGTYDSFMTDLVKEKFDNLGTEEFEEESSNEKLLRNAVVRVACELKYEPCVKWAKKLYGEWMGQENPDTYNPIPVDYRKIVQCVAIKSGDKLEWDFLWERTLSPLISPIDLRRAYLSLGCTDDYSLINRYIKLSLLKNITVENVPLVWKSINHPIGLHVGFRFLRINWNTIFKAYEDIYSIFGAIFKEFLSNLSTQVDLDDLTVFYTQHQESLKSLATVIQETVDIIKSRIQWKNRHLKTILSWLEEEEYTNDV